MPPSTYPSAPEQPLGDGPNGAGKSNLGSAIALPLLLLQYGLRGPREGSDPLEVYEQAGRFGASAYSVSLDIELDQSWEQELVRLFVEAAVSAAAAERLSGITATPEATVLALFAQLGVPADSVSSLLRGTLHIAYSARHQTPWWAAWNFRHEEEQFQLVLKGPSAGRLHRGHFLPWTDGVVNPFRTVIAPLGYAPQASGSPALESFLRQEYSPRAGKRQPSAVDFGLILNSLDQMAAFSMEVPVLTNGSGAEPVSLGDLARALGYERRGQVRFDFRFVLAEVLRRGLVPTDNRRLPLARHFPVAKLTGPIDLRDGSGVAAELYRLKNGDPAEQHRFEQVRKIFTDITQLDLHLRSLPAPAGATLVIDVLVGSDESSRVAQFAGAGIQEALLLATLLAGEPGRVVILDEPAVNLHPTMQRRLARHLATVQGIVITHSPDLIPCSDVEDLDRVVRLTAHAVDGTRVCFLDPDKRKRLGEWMQNLLLTDVRALLFASGVVLCEGGTDLGALSRWWANGVSDLGDPEGANIAMVDVGGDNNFGGYVNYLEAFQIPWAAVADGPAFSPQSGLSKQLTNLGLAPAGGKPGQNDGFEEWRQYWNRAGVFTVADAFGKDATKSGEFEAFLERLNSTLLEEMRATHGKSKPRVGAAFAAAHPVVPNEVAQLYRQIRNHLELG